MLRISRKFSRLTSSSLEVVSYVLGMNDTFTTNAWRSHLSPVSKWITDRAVSIGDTIWYSTCYDQGEGGMVQFDPKTDSMRNVVKYPSDFKPRYQCCCELHGIIYIIYDWNSSLMVSFDPKNYSFSKECDLPGIGISASCLALNDHIHILNGWSNTQHLIFNVTTKKLEKYKDSISSCDQSRDVSLIEYEGKMIRFGGKSRNNITNGTLWMSSKIEIEGHGSIQWNEMKQWKVPKQLSKCGLVRYQHYLFVFGGTDESMGKYGKEMDTIYALDLEREDGWKEVTEYKCPRCNRYTACLHGDSVYLIGRVHFEMKSIPLKTLMNSKLIEIDHDHNNDDDDDDETKFEEFDENEMDRNGSGTQYQVIDDQDRILQSMDLFRMELNAYVK